MSKPSIFHCPRINENPNCLLVGLQGTIEFMEISQPQRLTRSWFGAGLWLCCFQFFAAEQIARLAWIGHYSMQRGYISDLGAVHCTAEICSPLHRVMNGSFVLQGLLICFGTLFLRKLLARGRLDAIALWLLAVSGIGVFLVGLAPEDVSLRIHLSGAIANFVGSGLAMTVFGLVMIRRECDATGWVTLATGVVGLLATTTLAFRGSQVWTEWSWNAGLVERFAAYPQPLWLTWTGWRLLRGAR
jgi:hypothetical membrane protein